MNSLFVSRIHYKLTICSPFRYEFKIYFANLLWIHHRYRKLTINSLSISPIHFPFTLSREFSMNILSLPRIHYEFIFYTGCTQCATPKLPKKVLHIRDIVAHWGHCPGKIEMKFLIKKIGIFCPFWKTRVNLWWITVEFFDISGRKQF